VRDVQNDVNIIFVFCKNILKYVYFIWGLADFCVAQKINYVILKVTRKNIFKTQRYGQVGGGEGGKTKNNLD
jgi:hypothetical protein